ncbi:MAG: PIN domain-containing protein [Proteobacteria bacterium]|nr:PIN domain-containing protein [Pseudomonadota bacterium]
MHRHSILIDSGPLIALFDASDAYHKVSLAFIKVNTARLITSLASITETLHLLDFNRSAQTDFLEWIYDGAIEIENIEVADLLEIQQMMSKYTNLPMDFADACLVYLGNKLKIDGIATIDRDFDIYRLHKNKVFTTFIK